MEGDKIERAAGSGPETGAPVESDGLVPVVDPLRFGASYEQFGDGVGAGGWKL